MSEGVNDAHDYEWQWSVAEALATWQIRQLDWNGIRIGIGIGIDIEDGIAIHSAPQNGKLWQHTLGDDCWPVCQGQSFAVPGVRCNGPVIYSGAKSLPATESETHEGTFAALSGKFSECLCETQPVFG